MWASHILDFGFGASYSLNRSKHFFGLRLVADVENGAPPGSDVRALGVTLKVAHLVGPRYNYGGISSQVLYGFTYIGSGILYHYVWDTWTLRVG